MKRFILSVFFSFLTLSLFAEDGVFYLYTPDRVDALTSSGREFSKVKYPCAHSSLPFGTKIIIINSAGHKTLANIEVVDRVDMPDNYFAISRDAFTELGIQESCFKATYSIQEKGKNNTEWTQSAADDKWCEIKGVKSDNIFELYNKIIRMNSGNLKARFADDSLVIMFVQIENKDDVLNALKALGADISEVEVKKLERTPFRL